MIKVVLIISNLATGGAETMLLKLAQHIDRSRFHLTVISMTGEGEIGSNLSKLGIPVYHLGMRRGKLPNPLIIFKLARLLSLLNPNIVHTWMYHADLLGGLAARLAGYSNVIWCVRHSNLSRHENKLSTLVVVKVCSLLSYLIPARIISCSNRAKEIHIAAGYRADRFDVIPNGFELERFAPNHAARGNVRKELDLSIDVQLVGLIARFDPQKNHSGFWVAANKVSSHLPQVHFVLAGKGMDVLNAEVQASLTHFGLKDRVHLLGRREDIPCLMAALDVLASSSSGEAFPNVLGEAMACGVPCVVTDVGDSADIVGNTGIVVEPGDMLALAHGLIEILQMSYEDKEKLGKKTRARVADNYEIGHVVRQYEAFYEQLAINKKGKS